MTIGYFVTGTTRGIGKALAEQIVADADQLFSLSSAEDSEAACSRNVQCNFSASANVNDGFDRLLQSPQINHANALVLINNAGILDPMGAISSASDTQIVRHLMINQAAPAILMAAFIRHTANLGIKRRIINISSGAARHPYAGWTMYCAAKAALEMMTRCVAAEQGLCADPVSVCAVSPGKVDTQMQQQIRAASRDQFPAQPNFVDAYQRGELNTPKTVARMILSLDRTGQLRNGEIYDLRSVKQLDGQLHIDPILSYSH